MRKGTTTVTVSRTAATISSSLASFAKAYNSVVSELDKNHGAKNGALQGQSILKTVSDALHTIAGYSSDGGNIKSLTQLGLKFEQDGTLSFDSATFSSASKNQFTALADFLGTGKGSGFLKKATDTLKLLTGADTGVITQSLSMVSKQISRTNTAIDDRQDKVDALEKRLQGQMAAADAAIAALEQQSSYFSNMITAMQDAQRNN